MLYYKIKPEVDNRYSGKATVFSGELYTLREMKQRNIPLEWADVVSLEPSQTYTFFGARYEYNENTLRDFTKGLEN